MERLPRTTGKCGYLSKILQGKIKNYANSNIHAQPPLDIKIWNISCFGTFGR